MNPSLALIPSAYSAGKLYSVLPEDGTGDFDVSRNGTATYLGSDGLIKTAQANEPRLEFNTDGSFKGVLVEPVATNLLLRSEEFGVSPWVGVNGFFDLVANSSISPSGQNNADTIGTDGLSTKYIAQSVSINIDSKSYSFSIFFRKTFGLTTFPAASIFLGGGTPISSGFLINTNNGTLIPRNLNNATAIGSVVDCGNYWRLICTITNNNTNNNARCDVYPNVGDSSSWVFTNSGTAIIWGAQLEEGSVATSYIPTEGTTVTRPADIMTVQEPTGISEIRETVNGIEQAVSPTGGIYQLPNGHISRILMI